MQERKIGWCLSQEAIKQLSILTTGWQKEKKTLFTLLILFVRKEKNILQERKKPLVAVSIYRQHTTIYFYSWLTGKSKCMDCILILFVRKENSSRKKAFLAVTIDTWVETTHHINRNSWLHGKSKYIVDYFTNYVCKKRKKICNKRKLFLQRMYV